MRCVFLAFGTRGDVQPVAVLSTQYKARNPQALVTFITHAAHQGALLEVLQSSGVLLEVVSSKPVDRVHGECSEEHLVRPSGSAKRRRCDGAGAAAQDAAADQQRRFWGATHLQECTSACERALDCSGQTGAEPSRHIHRLIVFNLFALEGWHLAERLGARTVATHPYPIPYSTPSWLAQHFKRSHRALWDALHASESSQSGDGSPSSLTRDPHNRVRWCEVNHWMWALFSPRWTAWRTQLGLPPTPLLTFAGEAKLPSRTPLLYGFSENVVPVPGYWPTSVHTCGFWGWPDATLERVGALPRAVERWLGKAAPNQPLVVSLGMPADAGLIHRPKELCINLLGMATAAAVSLIVMLPADPANAFTRAWENLCGATATIVALDSSSGRQSHGWQSDGGDERRTVAHPSGALGVIGSVPFERLLPRCAAVMHHGGSGTTAAALRAGIPQVICPWVFDQHFWAEQMEWLGVAGAPIPHKALDSLSPDLTAAVASLRAALSPQTAARATQVALTLRGEDGVDRALNILEGEAEGHGMERDAWVPVERKPTSSSKGTATADSTADSTTATVRIRTADGEFEALPKSETEVMHLHREVFSDDIYLRHGVRVPSCGGCVVDVGANIGLFVLRVLAAVGDDAPPPRIIAVEPLPQTFQVLCRNLKAAGVWPHGCVEAVEAGLGDGTEGSGTGDDSSAAFTFYPCMPGNSTTRPAEKARLQGGCMHPAFFEGASEVQCTVTTLSRLMRDYRLATIELLKVDVEGAELSVLQGIDADHWRHIAQVVMEVHDVDGRLAEVVSLLMVHGYTLAVESLENCPEFSFMVWATRDCINSPAD